MMKRRIFKILIDADIESIIKIYAFSTLKMFFIISTTVLAFIQFILLLAKLNTITSDLGIILGIFITSLLSIFANIMHSRVRNKFLEKLDSGSDDNNTINKPIKKDKYRCP